MSTRVPRFQILCSILSATVRDCALLPFISRFLAEAHFLARDFSGCVAVSRKALQLHPHCWLLYRALGRALTSLGEYGKARSCYRRATLLYNAPQAALLAERAYLEAAAGDKNRAGRLIKYLDVPAGRQQVSFVSLAQIHAALGNQDRALECLEQACVNRDWSLSALKQDHRLDPLRTTHRFRKIVHRSEFSLTAGLRPPRSTARRRLDPPTSAHDPSRALRSTGCVPEARSDAAIPS